MRPTLLNRITAMTTINGGNGPLEGCRPRSLHPGEDIWPYRGSSLRMERTSYSA
jgi:hypothetical protein